LTWRQMIYGISTNNTCDQARDQQELVNTTFSWNWMSKLLLHFRYLHFCIVHYVCMRQRCHRVIEADKCLTSSNQNTRCIISCFNVNYITNGLLTSYSWFIFFCLFWFLEYSFYFLCNFIFPMGYKQYDLQWMKKKPSQENLFMMC